MASNEAEWTPMPTSDVSGKAPRIKAQANDLVNKLHKEAFTMLSEVDKKIDRTTRELEDLRAARTILSDFLKVEGTDVLAGQKGNW